MRLVFAGTPEAALPPLTALAASDHDLVAVISRPDAPAGRGRRLDRSPVARWADEHGAPVLTPRRPGDPDFLAELARIAPDCVPVVAYGALIPPAALALPPHGWVNLHFSLLPAWRGAAPVQRALIAGDEMTGATTFRIEQGLDTGDVYGTVTETIRPDDTAGDLLARLSQAGAGLLVATLDGIESGALVPRPQPAEGVSLAPKITVEEARIDWTLPGLAVERRIRGCTPEPGPWTTLNGERLRLGPVARSHAVAGSPSTTEPAPGQRPGGEPGSGARVCAELAPGQLRVGRRDVAVGTASWPVLLGWVQPAGRRPMAAADWARGVRPAPGARFM